jgi:hypothetical protein
LIQEGQSVWRKIIVRKSHFVGLNLPMQRPCELSDLLLLPLRRSRESPRQPLLPRLPRHPGGARARTNRKPLIYQPRLQNTPDNIERTGLDNPTPDWLASADADIYNALKRKREPVRGMFVERLRIERRH